MSMQPLYHESIASQDASWNKDFEIICASVQEQVLRFYYYF